MNLYFVMAGGLAIIVCFVHSVLGEMLLISRLTEDGLPALGGSKAFARRTLRLNWHLPTVLGCGLAANLLRLAVSSSPSSESAFIESATALTVLVASLIVLVVSRGKHPAWAALLGIAVLVWLGMN
jgi:hypothetical protein